MSRPFDDLMGHLDGPMVVVTTAAGDEVAGCLVGFHGQCGMEPPSYAVWLSKANRTYRIGALAEMFAIHFLAADQRSLAAAFGTQSGDVVDKFADVGWTAGPDGVPLLDACPNRIVGRRRAFLDAGTDHACLIVDPTAVDLDGNDRWLHLSDVEDLDAGHEPEERQEPR